MMNLLIIIWLMIKHVSVCCIIQCSILSLLHIQNASKYGMQQTENFKVFSEILQLRKLLVLHWMKERENYLLVIKKADYSQSISRMELKWRNSKSQRKTRKIKMISVVSIIGVIRETFWYLHLGMGRLDFMMIVPVSKKEQRDILWRNIKTVWTLLISSLHISYVHLVQMMAQ